MRRVWRGYDTVPRRAGLDLPRLHPRDRAGGRILSVEWPDFESEDRDSTQEWWKSVTGCPICTDVEPPENGYRNEKLLRHVYFDHELKQIEVAELFGCCRTTIKNWFREHGLSGREYKYDFSEDDLREWYIDNELSINEIAEKVGCSYLAVHNRLEKHGIETRPSGGSPDDEADTSFRDEDELRCLYHDEALSKTKIAEQCGVAESTVQYWMNKYGIEARGYDEAQNKRRIRNGAPYRDEETLRRLYWEDGFSQREIADKLGCGFPTVQTWMKRHGIELRYAGAHGNTYETDRGEYVRSSHERQIANWLHERGIDYEYEPELDGVSLVPDFLVGGAFVEYWGMLNREDYCKRMHEKQDEYDGLDVRLVNLFPHDLDDLSDKLGEFADE